MHFEREQVGLYTVSSSADVYIYRMSWGWCGGGERVREWLVMESNSQALSLHCSHFPWLIEHGNLSSSLPPYYHHLFLLPTKSALLSSCCYCCCCYICGQKYNYDTFQCGAGIIILHTHWKWGIGQGEERQKRVVCAMYEKGPDCHH